MVTPLATGQIVEWGKWLLFGLAGGLLISSYSFQTLLQHGTLRVLLRLNQASPWNYADFLTYASELRLLQNLGGRYRFVHDLLREHLIANRPLPRRHTTSLLTVVIAAVVAVLVALPISNGLTPVSTETAEFTAPALQADDLVFYDPYSYRFFNPSRFELIRYFADDTPSTRWVVGLPGDQIASRDGKLLINGQSFDHVCTHLPEDYSVEPFQIPDHHYLVVGKIQSNDGIRPFRTVVDRSQITGRFVWRVFPLHRFGSIRCDRTQHP